MIFKEIAAHKIEHILEEYKGKQFLILSSGSLQYVQPEHIEIFFQQLSTHSVTLIFCEPYQKEKMSALENRKSCWRGNFSYNHNYKAYGEKNGFVTGTWRLITGDDDIGEVLYASEINSCI